MEALWLVAGPSSQGIETALAQFRTRQNWHPVIDGSSSSSHLVADVNLPGEGVFASLDENGRLSANCRTVLGDVGRPLLEFALQQQ